MHILGRYQAVFGNYLTQSKLDGNPTSLYEPCNYLLNIGGKRIRPALVLAAYDLFSKKNDLTECLPVALSLEIFHNFTLMHDDIMDDSQLRRNQATVHAKYGINAAILSGDAMLIHAYQLLRSSIHFCTHFDVFSQMAKELCEGQRMDMDFELQENVSIDCYLKMIELKTAVLLGASMQMGAIEGGASEIDAFHLYEYGKNIGIAFQIQDDILDTFGDDKVGKKIGGDIVQNKKTYLYLKALELATEPQRKELLFHYSHKDEKMEQDKIKAVTSIFHATAVVEYATQVKDAYRDLAVSHLVESNALQSKKEELIAFADFLTGRNH